MLGLLCCDVLTNTPVPLSFIFPTTKKKKIIILKIPTKRLLKISLVLGMGTLKLDYMMDNVNYKLVLAIYLYKDSIMSCCSC